MNTVKWILKKLCQTTEYLGTITSHCVMNIIPENISVCRENYLFTIAFKNGYNYKKNIESRELYQYPEVDINYSCSN